MRITFSYIKKKSSNTYEKSGTNRKLLDSFSNYKINSMNINIPILKSMYPSPPDSTSILFGFSSLVISPSDSSSLEVVLAEGEPAGKVV